MNDLPDAERPTAQAVDLTLRGHHFLCSLHYQGAGYSDAFTANFTAIAEGIAARGRSTVRVADQADGICGACPSLQADGQACAYQASVMRRDQALLDGMGWRHGQVLDLEAAYWGVIEKREALMADVCTDCEWLPRCLEKGPNGLASPLRRGLSPSAPERA